MYKHPGVYIEHVPSGLLAVEAVATAVAAFIGPVPRGKLVTDDKEKGEPVFISNMSQYEAQFGPLKGGAGGLRDYGSEPDVFGWAVQSYMMNGGSKAYIVPVGDGNGKESSGVIRDPLDKAKALSFTAASAGEWANAMTVKMSLAIEDNNDPKLTTYDVEIGLEDDKGNIDPVLESFSGMVMDPDSGQYLAGKINAASSLVTVKHESFADLSVEPVVGVESAKVTADLSTGLDGKTLEVDFDGDNITGADVTAGKVKVTFDTASTSLAAIAAQIADALKGTSTASVRQNLTVKVTDKDTILIMPGKSSASPANVNVLTVVGGTAKSTLGFDSPKAVYNPELIASGTDDASTTLAGGKDHGSPDPADYMNALLHLRDYRDITMLMLPGKVWNAEGKIEIGTAVTHAEFMQNRMVLVDPPKAEGSDRLQTPKDVKDLGATTSPYTALYYPWVEVANPFYDPDIAANLPKTFLIPPGSFAAGLWARIDGSRGVWKAPAGLEATVRGALGPNIDIGADLQDNLNEWGVNCMRSIIGPPVIWGARTLASKSKPEFRYVPVRRTQNMIGESLYNALQAVVFEPNDHKLWASLRASANAFMDTLHRAGAFQGEKASDAYYVRCGLGTTMTQADIDAGVVRLVVGFAPLKPAEFVVVQIKQIVGQTA